MRYLNKIIFLNSANIQKAEIMLNGNVHFSGTQGVGKSTILRAILFFYNADKMHLGISTSQKSFEEFYFPDFNSYIVYEVAIERGFFSILVSRNQGQICFRFIDAPFDYKWLVDENRNVEVNWPKIHSNIGSNIFVSNKINTYEQYRDIIFGNKLGKTRGLERFALVESSKYQNIPKSIQNVFLNSKLDADFIKDTLINSIDDAEVRIKLDNYRTWLAKFEKEFKEIDCWFKKDKSGGVPIRKTAYEMIVSLKNITAVDYEALNLWHQLNYAVEKSYENIPLLNDKIANLSEEISALLKKDSEFENEYKKKHDQLLKKLGELDSLIKICREKRKYYDQEKIEALLEEESRKPQLEKTLEALKNKLGVLKAQFQEIDIKYKFLRDNIFNEVTQFDLECKKRLTEFLSNKNSIIEKERENSDKEKTQLDSEFDIWDKEFKARREILYQEYMQAEHHLIELKHWKPKEKERYACQEEIASLREEKNLLTPKIKRLESQIENLQQKFEFQLKDQEREINNRLEEIKSASLECKKALETIDKRLKDYDKSFYEWLSKNKGDWKENIGKLIEEDLLYQTDLEPTISTEGADNFYGVKLNLKSISYVFLTPDDLKIKKKKLEDTLKEYSIEGENLMEEKNKFISNLNQSFKRNVGELNKDKASLSYRMDLVPEEIKSLETKLRLINDEEKILIEEERKIRENLKNEAWNSINNEDKIREQKLSEKNRKKSKIDATFNSLKTKLYKEEQNLKLLLEKEQSSKQKEKEKTLKEVDAQEKEELENKGADNNAIDEVNRNIEKTRNKLNEIASKHDIIARYLKDKEEYFDKEQTYKNQKSQIEEKDANLSDTFAKTHNKRLIAIENKKREKNSIASQRDAFSEGIKAFKTYTEIEKGIPLEILEDTVIKKTSGSCVELISALRGKFADKTKCFNDLKRQTHHFTSFFDQDNMFNFKFPTFDEDFIPFANEVREFLEDNKIKEYQSRTNILYKDILASLTRETSLLLNSSSQINSVILALNDDFRRKNFAGVIKKIELRAMESSDPIMQLIMSIQNFTIENQLNLGESTLFSDLDNQKTNDDIIEYLKRLLKELQRHPEKKTLSLSDTFRLQFRIQENDNDSGFKEHLSHIGSDGTDILVKAIVNILLINVFKEKASKKNKDFIIHCMMDEIGKLHPANVAGILQFANSRNIYLINSSPMSYNADAYKHNYVLTKDARSKTIVQRTITILSE